MKWLQIFLLLPCLLAAAAHADDEENGGSSGKDVIPLPRFASLRFSEVNTRTGPGTRYPIEWVYRRAELPVEIIQSHEAWYRIRDHEHAEGWVHKTKVRMARRGIVMNQLHAVRTGPDEKSAIAAHVEPGVIFELQSCDVSWCEVRGAEYEGYLRKSDFYGAYPQEKFN
ncbi:MAG: SH3 domain-containing protein [Alphaproteobacteria bacterium]